MRNRMFNCFSVLILTVGMMLLFGCQSQPSGLGVNPGAQSGGRDVEPSMASDHARAVTVPAVDPLNLAESADLERKTEVEMVEDMARCRNAYKESLHRLEQFYNHQGNQMKAKWAEGEQLHLTQGPQWSYLVPAEVAGPNLRASKSVLEADLLFKEGMKYYQDGRGSLGGMFADKKLLYQAIKKFDELITNYPESNMIDDAAFQIAQIDHLYLKDYSPALLYYQRALQWTGGQTTLPVRFQMAKIYDEALHNWPKAIQYYEQAINLEPGYPQNVEWAKNRIKTINEEMTKR